MWLPDYQPSFFRDFGRRDPFKESAWRVKKSLFHSKRTADLFQEKLIQSFFGNQFNYFSQKIRIDIGVFYLRARLVFKRSLNNRLTHLIRFLFRELRHPGRNSRSMRQKMANGNFIAVSASREKFGELVVKRNLSPIGQNQHGGSSEDFRDGSDVVYRIFSYGSRSVVLISRRPKRLMQHDFSV